MKPFVAILLLLASASAQSVSLINGVRALIAGHDFPAAERMARAYQARNGSSPELAASLSWLARAAFDAKNLRSGRCAGSGNHQDDIPLPDGPEAG